MNAAAPSHPPSEPDRPQARTSGGAAAVRLMLPAAAVALVESLLLLAFAKGQIGWIALLLAHAAVTGLLAAWAVLIARSDSDSSMPLLSTIAVAAAGPVGAIAALATFVSAGWRRDDPQVLADWYARIAMAVETDDVSRLCEQVTTGRTAALTCEPPRSYAAAMARGSLDERQAALGVIARNFHPDYLPVLMLALKSPEPVIRVQAAAVATRIRGDLRSLVDRLASATDTESMRGPEAATAATQLDAAVASGLLDESDRIRAGVIAARLRTVAESKAGPRARTLAPLPALQRASNEAMLLGARRFGDLRVGRRLAAVSAAGSYRVRRPRSTARAGSV